VQVIESGKVREEDGGGWLKNLRGGLNGERLREIIEKGKRMPKGAPLSAYISMVLQANVPGTKELAAMSEAALETALKECGLITKWETRGLEKGLEKGRGEAIRRLQRYGMDQREIAKALGLPLRTVLQYLKVK
jgi:hypothetical protein